MGFGTSIRPNSQKQSALVQFPPPRALTYAWALLVGHIPHSLLPPFHWRAGPPCHPLRRAVTRSSSSRANNPKLPPLISPTLTARPKHPADLGIKPLAATPSLFSTPHQAIDHSRCVENRRMRGRVGRHHRIAISSLLGSGNRARRRRRTIWRAVLCATGGDRPHIAGDFLSERAIRSVPSHVVYQIPRAIDYW
jgi:hypothetical protein